MIFDATILLNRNNKDCLRSGTYFVAKNIYERLRHNPNFNIYLYFDVNDIDCFLANSPAFDDPIVNDFDNLAWKCFFRINKKMWALHKRFFDHSILRKPFALGIVASQKLIKTIKPVDQRIVSKCQVYFSPLCSPPKSIRKRNHLLFFTILHDAIPYFMPEDCGVAWTKELKKIVRCVKKNNFFICVSHNSFLDFNKINPNISSKNTFVVPLAAGDEFHEKKNENDCDKLLKKYGIPKGKKFAFCLSSVSPRKNFNRIIRTFLAFVESDHVDDLVIVVSGAGSKDELLKLKKQQVYKKEWIDEIAYPTDYISDEEKVILYQHAEWFVYTSRYEGFGLPPLEAMQCGCPVITSNNSSLPEVVGDAGIMIDWNSDEQHIEAYKLLYENKQLRETLKKKALRQAENFAWDKTVLLIERAVQSKINQN